MAGGARAGMFARGEFDLGATPALTVPQSAVVVRDGFSYVYRLTPDNHVSQVKVQTGRLAGDRLEILGGLAADARIVAAGAGFLNDGDLVRVVEGPQNPAAPPERAAGAASVPAATVSRHVERLLLVDPQPDAGGDAVRAAELRGHAVVPGDEGAELSRHRPADRARHGLAAWRGAGPAGNRRGAQDRELDRHPAGPQAHLHQGAGRRRHHHRGVPPGKAGAGSGGRRALGRRRRAQRLAGRRARPDRHQDGPGRPAGAGLHGCLRRAWTRKPCPGSSTTTSRASCWPCGASAPSTASAA